jgi:UDPglucose 6-dehydrogenase
VGKEALLMRLTIFGAGYVGLVTAACLAELGHDVLCVDVSEVKISKLRDGVLPIYEPGLGDLVKRNVHADRLQFSTEIDVTFEESDAYFIAVGTPPRVDGSADTSALFDVAYLVSRVAKKDALVVVKSTVPVGTCDELQAVADDVAHITLEIVSNPEFLKEGRALDDFFRPDRVVIGTRTKSAADTVCALYAPLQISGECMIVCDPKSSELTKYAANAMLAMRVSFMNELSRLCHAVGADIHAVRLGVGSDARIGKKFLYAGPGWGGSCFPKDVRALAHIGRSNGVPMKLAEAAYQANAEQAHFLAELVENAVGGDLRGKTIALWGLAFKPETDDVRDAPSIKLTEALLAQGATIVGHDPEAAQNYLLAVNQPARVSVVAREYEAVSCADALVLLTEWRCYLAPDFCEIKRRMRGASVVDARNVWKRDSAKEAGLHYQGIGTR